MNATSCAADTAPTRHRIRVAGGGVLAVLVLLLGSAPAPAAAVPRLVQPEAPGVFTPAPVLSSSSDAAAASGWQWPLSESTVVGAYEAPAHAYGPGHRGVDLASAGADTVRAPAAGVIAFSGRVADRGIVTIDHGDGLVTTLEPVEEGLTVGSTVAAGEPVARLSVGGHARAGTLHFGVRRDGVYINPLSLLGGVPRAVLLPCCS